MTPEKDRDLRKPKSNSYYECEKCGFPVTPRNGVLLQGAIFAVDEKYYLEGIKILAGGMPAQKVLTAWHAHCLWEHISK